MKIIEKLNELSFGILLLIAFTCAIFVINMFSSTVSVAENNTLYNFRKDKTDDDLGRIAPAAEKESSDNAKAVPPTTTDAISNDKRLVVPEAMGMPESEVEIPSAVEIPDSSKTPASDVIVPKGPTMPGANNTIMPNKNFVTTHKPKLEMNKADESRKYVDGNDAGTENNEDKNISAKDGDTKNQNNKLPANDDPQQEIIHVLV